MAPAPWEAAVALADAWLPPITGSLESRRLQAAARHLIQAVTFEAWNREASPPTRDKVRRLLAEELRLPGKVLEEMATSSNRSVADAARATLGARSWVAVEGGKNVVVAQAVLSLNAGSAWTARGPSRDFPEDAEQPQDQVRAAALPEM